MSAMGQIVLQKSPSGLCEIEICNYRIGAPILLNRCCAFQPDLESIFLAEMLKILLQHNRSKCEHPAYVGRSTLDSRPCSARLTRQKSAKSGHWPTPPIDSLKMPPSPLQCITDVSASASLAQRIGQQGAHSTDFFLNHAQMDPESVQIDFEWACNLEQPRGRFNFGDPCLILDKTASVCAVSEFAFEVA